MRAFVSKPLFVLAYKASVDAISLKIILISSILNPIFYVAFFLIIRVQSIDLAEVPELVLLALYLMPIGNSTFFMASSFGRLKNWGALRHIMLSPRGLLTYGFFQAIPATAISFFAIFTVSIVADIFLPSLDLRPVIFDFALLTCLLSISAMAFGTLCAILILPLKDFLIITNSLFFLVVLASGVVLPLPDQLTFMRYLTPIGAPAAGLSAILNGTEFQLFALISICTSSIYIILSIVFVKLVTRVIKKTGFIL